MTDICVGSGRKECKACGLGKGAEVANSGLMGRQQASSPCLLVHEEQRVFLPLLLGSEAFFPCSLTGEVVHRAAISVKEPEEASERTKERGGMSDSKDTIYRESKGHSWAPGEWQPPLWYCAKPWVLWKEAMQRKGTLRHR